MKLAHMRIVRSRSFSESVSIRSDVGRPCSPQEALTEAGFLPGDQVAVVLESDLEALQPTQPAPSRGNTDWIQTSCGAKFYPLDPRPQDIRLLDIAHALANVCRFTGHVERFYSVAEHSVRVSRRVFDLTGDPKQAYWGLLHDASEAYIADVSRPLKHLPAFAAYREAEARLQAVICDRFGLPHQQPEVVTRADCELLGVEATALMSPIHPDWLADAPKGAFPPAFTPSDRLGWSPSEAESQFHCRFLELAAAGALS